MQATWTLMLGLLELLWEDPGTETSEVITKMMDMTDVLMGERDSHPRQFSAVPVLWLWGKWPQKKIPTRWGHFRAQNPNQDTHEGWSQQEPWALLHCIEAKSVWESPGRLSPHEDFPLICLPEEELLPSSQELTLPWRNYWSIESLALPQPPRVMGGANG